MPFHQRSVEPARLRRPVEAAAARAAGAPLFRSLEQVSSHSLVCLLAQLADLSRCAGDIFGELESQAAALGHRTAELHRRLDALHATASRLDHRRVKIREWLVAPGRHRGPEAFGQLLPPAPWRPRLGSPAASGAHGCQGFRWEAMQVAGAGGELRFWLSWRLPWWNGRGVSLWGWLVPVPCQWGN